MYAGYSVRRIQCTQGIVCAGYSVRRVQCRQNKVYAGNSVRRLKYCTQDNSMIQQGTSSNREGNIPVIFYFLLSNIENKNVERAENRVLPSNMYI